MKKKACTRCRMFIDGQECPTCKTSQFSTSWKGRLQILDPEKSFIAKKIGMKIAGEYAIKVR